MAAGSRPGAALGAKGGVWTLNDTRAQTQFVVDTTSPTITSVTPAAGSQATVTNNFVTVTLTTSQNVDPATINTSSILAVRSGGDGIFGNANDVPLTVSNITVPTPIPGTTVGAETISFRVNGVTANDIYQVTLKGTGNAPIKDWAGNALDGNPALAGNQDYVTTFVVLSSAIKSRTIFVSASATGLTPTGTRANPYKTIAAGLAVANIGDTVAVLPGLYPETVTLKSLVKVLSASPNSTDTALIPGQALQTIIKPPISATGTTVAVIATNLPEPAQLPDRDRRLHHRGPAGQRRSGQRPDLPHVGGRPGDQLRRVDR